MAAQMLSGKGFNTILNLTGGFNHWEGNAALGKEELGLSLFTGNEAPEDTLVVAYSLEQGLRDFYLSMLEEVENAAVSKLFTQLSEIEILHQDAIFNRYIDLTGDAITREAFEEKLVADAVEGGLTTQEYINYFMPDLDDVADIVGLAMSIEAQALDMYMRVSEKIENQKSKEIVMQIAKEEHMHLAQLGKLMDSL